MNEVAILIEDDGHSNLKTLVKVDWTLLGLILLFKLCRVDGCSLGKVGDGRGQKCAQGETDCVVSTFFGSDQGTH